MVGKNHHVILNHNRPYNYTIFWQKTLLSFLDTSCLEKEMFLFHVSEEKKLGNPAQGLLFCSLQWMALKFSFQSSPSECSKHFLVCNRPPCIFQIFQLFAPSCSTIQPFLWEITSKWALHKTLDVRIVTLATLSGGIVTIVVLNKGAILDQVL